MSNHHAVHLKLPHELYFIKELILKTSPKALSSSLDLTGVSSNPVHTSDEKRREEEADRVTLGRHPPAGNAQAEGSGSPSRSSQTPSPVRLANISSGRPNPRLWFVYFHSVVSLKHNRMKTFVFKNKSGN